MNTKQALAIGFALGVLFWLTVFFVFVYEL